MCDRQLLETTDVRAGHDDQTVELISTDDENVLVKMLGRTPRARISCPLCRGARPASLFQAGSSDKRPRETVANFHVNPPLPVDPTVCPVETDDCDGSHDTQTFPAVRRAPRPPELLGGHVPRIRAGELPSDTGHTNAIGASPQGEQVAGVRSIAGCRSYDPSSHCRESIPVNRVPRGVADECNHWRNTTRRFSGSWSRVVRTDHGLVGSLR